MSRVSRDLANGTQDSVPNGDSSLMQSLRQVLGRVPDIAVIGAGVSGLRCADLLIRHGAKVTIYEARDRVGGRLHQEESGGYLMDMGPNWIHGSQNNPILKLAKTTQTTTMEPPEGENASFDIAGRRLPDEVAEELSESMWSTVIDAFKYSDDHSASIDPQTSLYDYFVQSLPKKIHDPVKLQLTLDEARAWGPVVGDPIERQSLKFFFLEECIDDGNVFVASTYKSILREIAKNAVHSKTIRFNTEITHITRRPDQVEVLTALRERHAYDEVVVTCPLGWLKRNHATSFTPSLPTPLAAAINHINYGRLEKLYITFPSAWWNNSPTGSYPIFTNFHLPTYHPDGSSKSPHPSATSWSQSLVLLSNLPHPHSHPTLLFYLHGDCATSVVNSITHLTPHSSSYNDTLINFSKPFYSLLPNYDERNQDCTPSALLCTQWQSDPFAGNGAYCNFQIGLKHADKDIEIMRDSGGLWRGGLTDSSTSEGASLVNGVHLSALNQTNTESEACPEAVQGMKPGGIHLAGEHTAPFVAIGTTTGAYWSGERVARRILGKYGMKIEVEDE